MKTSLLAVVVVLSCASAAAAERLTDKELGQLISRIASEEDRFRDALDPQLKRTTFRGPAGEVNVEQFLKDFSDAAERLEDRFKQDYSASVEAGALLRQGTQIDAYFHRDHAATRGESEWNRFAEHLEALAAAYGTDFPLPDGAATRRIGDREVVTTAEGLARDADRLRKVVDDGLKKDKAVDKPTREGVLREIALVKKDAGTLKSGVSGGRPSSAEATQLLGRLAKVQELLVRTPVAAASPMLEAIGAKARLISQAFGLAPTLATR